MNSSENIFNGIAGGQRALSKGAESILIQEADYVLRHSY